MENLQNFGVEELDAKELISIDGGKSWWQHATNGYATLTDDFVGIMSVAIFPGPCLLAIAISATIDVAQH
jgi:hypothetical protein